MESKQENILELFFNYPAKQWHFEEIVKTAKIARSKADRWLKLLTKKELIKRVKLSGKMPYYIGNYDSPTYKNKKKLFALTKLDESGLLDHLSSLPKANTVILFGSYSRSDWYKESDIDIFIHGDAQGLKIAEYELKLHRDIQLFICHDKEELIKLGPGLIRNIIRGNFIKGDLDFIEVSVHG
ncbi:MAG TPA: nucleotidyltransferase domain-containing protein [Candidatus Nanoarchaeia archaeon]|nr:nucleotidyltransferase domain-containing protein [Candidatus Nanoarchaeia archaeon]